MNPVIAAVLEKNKPDIKAIVDKIGIEGIMDLMPNILNIIKTAQEASAPK